MGRIIAVSNQKGGVGKTTTVINLGASLAAAERKVLLVDIDPQGNLTSGLGKRSREPRPSLYEALLENRPLDEVVVSTDLACLKVAPSGRDLSGAEIELVPLEGREYKLANTLKNHRDQYDFILIDCPPSLSLLTINALTAADTVLIPLQCEYFALEGVTEIVSTIQKVKRAFNAHLAIEGILLTMVDERTNLGQQVIEEIHRHFSKQVFQVTVPRSVRLAEAPSFGKPILLYDIRSRGAQAYLELAKEIMGHGHEEKSVG